MLSTDREAFDAEVAILFGGFGGFLTPAKTDAYWRGLAKMSLDVFKRCVTRALEGGDEKLPTVHRIWEISRQLRHQAAVPRQDEYRTLQLSVCHRYGNRALFDYLWRKGAASAASLSLILAEKAKLCDAYDLITSEEPEAGLELRDKLFAAWDAVWQAMPPEESIADADRLAKAGHL